jgi:hypothetical protein
VTRTPTVTCPTCRAPVPWTDASPWRPFCSARCKGIDLGDWASDRFVIAGELLGAADEDPGPPVAPRQ